jgi:hypothetical protein
MANKFTLKVDRVEVSYTIGATPGIPALIYKDQKMSKEFEANEIHTDSTTLGSLLTVTLEVTVDHGGTTFSFFLPSLHVSARAIEFNTIGINKAARTASSRATALSGSNVSSAATSKAASSGSLIRRSYRRR